MTILMKDKPLTMEEWEHYFRYYEQEFIIIEKKWRPFCFQCKPGEKICKGRPRRITNKQYDAFCSDCPYNDENWWYYYE